MTRHMNSSDSPKITLLNPYYWLAYFTFLPSSAFALSVPSPNTPLTLIFDYSSSLSFLNLSHLSHKTFSICFSSSKLLARFLSFYLKICHSVTVSVLKCFCIFDFSIIPYPKWILPFV